MNIKLNHCLLFFYCMVLLPKATFAQPLSSLMKKADSLRELDNSTALQAYNDALKKSISENNADTTGLIYLRTGITFERRSLYEKALQNYFEALKVFNHAGLKENAAIVKKNIGNVYRSTRKFESAFFYVNSSYIESKQLHDSTNIVSALNDLGLICMDQQKIEKALFYFKAALNSAGNKESDPAYGSTITNLASIYWIKKEYPKAIVYYQRACNFTKRIGDKHKMAIIWLNMGGLYSEMHQYNKALDAQQKGMKLAKLIKAKDLLQFGYNNYAEIYGNMGSYKKAYKAALNSSAWKDSVYSEISDQYRLSEVSYQNEEGKIKREQQETRNRLLKNENDLQTSQIKNKEKQLEQRNWLMGAVIIIASLVVLSFFLLYKAYRVRQQNQVIKEKQRSLDLENQLKETELTALRAQMNPHFIFNALSSIKNYMLEQNVQLADYYLGKFAKLIRLILDNSSQHFVSLEKELQLLDSYIQLEQLRFEDKFTYDIKMSEEINTMETFIPSMIIQPFVENAIIHGFMHKEGECHLNIDIKKYSGYLTIIILDDGIGRAQSAAIRNNSGNTLHQSKGYQISERRLKVLSHKINADTGIVYKDLADDKGATGTMVHITIPTESN